MDYSLDKVQAIAMETRNNLLAKDITPPEKIIVAGFVLQLLIVQFVKKPNRDNAHIQVHKITSDLVRDGHDEHNVVYIK